MNESSFFDDFGRYIGNDHNHKLIYGDNNRVTSITISKNISLVNYHYDDDNNPILKIKNKKLSKNIEFYFGDSVLTDDNLILPIKIQNIVVGYYKNKDFFPVSVDKRNSLVANVNNQANFSSPFGERISHAPNSKKEDEWSQIIDYTLKGYDSDLNAVRMGSRFYDPKAKIFLTPDSFFLENPEKIISSPVEGNLYSYAQNNPISFVDPSGQNAWLIQDIQGAGGKGHSAIVIGNQNDGYYLMSMGTRGGTMNQILSGSTREGVGIIKGNSFNDVISQSHKIDTIQIYDKALELNTTREQDIKMINYGIERSQNDMNYSPFFNNCGDFVRDTFNMGGISSERFTIPNDYYDNFKTDHQSSTEININNPRG